MTSPSDLPDPILAALRERAKELHCLYLVHELTERLDTPLDETVRGVAAAIPPAWQYPDVCSARIACEEVAAASTAGGVETPWVQRAPIVVDGKSIGRVEVFYTEERPIADEGPFLKEERKLLDTIADRLGQLVARRRLAATRFGQEQGRAASPPQPEWMVVIEFLRRTDEPLLRRLARRMVNHLASTGVTEAQRLLQRATATLPADEATGDNAPIERRVEELPGVADAAFKIAGASVSGAEIIELVQRWIKDDRASFLVEAVENPGSSIQDVSIALDRFVHGDVAETELSRATQMGLRVGLIRRILTDDVAYVAVAKQYMEVRDFHRISQRVIAPAPGFGRLGGKSSGLVLAAEILAQSPDADLAASIKTPRSWYVTSDALLQFINANQLQDVHNWKYRELEQIRREYPHLVQVFKQSLLPPVILNGLSLALDDLGDRPIVVRSSSLLEDRIATAFAGKYKSLFLANRGSKAERLAALADAVAEIYASAVGPDPIEYRATHGLLDLHEEMGILIQEVVGARIGPYHFPILAGVAFSQNELRWSPRIRRSDGLLRLVPGLGTRAVDRLGDDYPVLIAPAQPTLRVNVEPDEVLRYAPQRLDVINLEARRFETIEWTVLVRAHAREIPRLHQMVSRCDHDGVRPIMALDGLAAPERLAITFDGIIRQTSVVRRLRALLALLQDRFGGPVDLEFAYDGEDLYLLQCRPQSAAAPSTPVAIPRDLPADRIVFTANRFVSNGRVPDLTHVVYVDPDRYAALASLEDLKRVGRAVGRLNRVLPRRGFILMGPGRWGSRGDIRLGVSVTYADLNNAAMLVEIARQRGGYVPDLSFGTHFFQDLVEADIRYLPLFPDDPAVQFNERFLAGSPNALSDLAPEFADLADTVRAIDVPRSADGAVLRVLLNADLDEAVGYLVKP
jgi:hypothetical protein